MKSARIDHLAIWVSDLDASKFFYENYMGAKSNNLYHNPTKDFSSYFLSFENNDVRLELMHSPEVQPISVDTEVSANPRSQHLGLIHLAFSLGSKEKVVELTTQLKMDGYRVISDPRTTGDGYFESVVLDPEGNMIELTV